MYITLSLGMMLVMDRPDMLLQLQHHIVVLNG